MQALFHNQTKIILVDLRFMSNKLPSQMNVKKYIYACLHKTTVILIGQVNCKKLNKTQWML